MIICPTCSQPLGEEVSICPHCSAELTPHRTRINGYTLTTLLREGHASLLFRGRKAETEEEVLLRVFKPEAAIDATKADQLRSELDRLAQLTSPRLVRHRELACTDDGTWYRVSEWVDVVSWGDLIASRFFQQPRGEKKVLALFIEMAAAVGDLHEQGLIIPFLTKDDILIHRNAAGELAVKIDYKLSRALDPDLAQPSLILQKLTTQHPDCRAQRPLDMRSDIWPLGKIFVELLADSSDLPDLAAAIEQLHWHRKVRVLLRQMIEDDPALRVHSITRVIELLTEVTDTDLDKARKHFTEQNKAPLRQARRLSRLVASTFFILLLVLGGAFFLQRQYGYFFRDDTATLASHADQYTRSVAYVAVHYWLEVEGKKVYVSLTEGTAFLVDTEGYLLTNRHVACPWLKDADLFQSIQKLEKAGKKPEFGYAMALWFDGSKALKKSRENTGLETRLQDLFYLDGAYRSGGTPSVAIAGVLTPPQGKRSQIESPLGDDVAVLKIDRLPAGVIPLPLNAEPKDAAATGKRPVIAAIGFPLGSESNMESILRSSVTFGHVRRNFPHVIQVDVSIHPGNSGGPVVNANGQVVGIASAAFTEGSQSSAVAQSDFGLILPIDKAIELLRDIKNNQPKWDGVIDLQQPRKIAAVFQLAEQGDWQAAQNAINSALLTSHDPNLFVFGGLIHLAAGSPEKGRQLLQTAIAIEPANGLAKFLTYLCDWKLGKASENLWRQELLQLNWLSPDEFYGYLVKIIERKVDGMHVLKTGENQREQALLLYATALYELSREGSEKAEPLLGKALQKLERTDYFSILIRAELNKVQALDERKGATNMFVSERSWLETLVATRNAQRIDELKQEIVAIGSRHGEKESDQQANIAKSIRLYQELKKLDPEDTSAIIALSTYLAFDGKWSESLTVANEYLATPGRECSNRLGMGLLRGQLLYALGQAKESEQALRAFADQTTDPWYRGIAQALLGEITPDTLDKPAQDSPQGMLTLYTALGFQAESKGQTEIAVNYYSLALESHLDNWLEYTFAKTRMRRLRASKA